MLSVPHEFDSPQAARDVLTRALTTATIPAPAGAPAGTTCKLCLRAGELSLELFAVATATGFRLTDDPSDLRYEIQYFLDRLFPDPTTASLANSVPEVPAELEVLAEPEGHAVTVEPEAPIEPAVHNEFDGAFVTMADEIPAEGVAENEINSEFAAEPEIDLEDPELAGFKHELDSKDPIMAEVKRIQALTLPQKIRLAEDGELTQRMLLFRMYGKLVFDGLLRNPRLTEMEVAKLAKLGTLSVPLLQVIARKTEWLRTERIRNALLSNPRTPQAILQKIVSMISRQDLRQLIQRRDFSPAAQVALREQNARLLKG